MTTTNTIYIDMDGVVADFDGAARTHLDADQSEFDRALLNHRWSPEQWEKLRSISHLYLNLPKTSYADEIIELARKFRDDLGWKLFMLTAIPKKNDIPECFYDKIIWMQKYYPDIEVRFGPYSFDKQHHCRPGDILVDDRPDNCEQWQTKQGLAFLLKPYSYIDTIEQLTNTLTRLKNNKGILNQVILD